MTGKWPVQSRSSPRHTLTHTTPNAQYLCRNPTATSPVHSCRHVPLRYSGPGGAERRAVTAEPRTVVADGMGGKAKEAPHVVASGLRSDPIRSDRAAAAASESRDPRGPRPYVQSARSRSLSRDPAAPPPVAEAEQGGPAARAAVPCRPAAPAGLSPRCLAFAYDRCLVPAGLVADWTWSNYGLVAVFPPTSR